MTTTDRTTWFTDKVLNLPENRFNSSPTSDGGLESKLRALQEDKRPLNFSSPLYNPLTPELLTVVHTPNNPETGGFQGKYVRGGPHSGIDIKSDSGVGVLSAEDGVVVIAGEVGKYGNVIYVNHRGGFQTRYAHLSEINVKVGDAVKKGELIGSTGTTGNAGKSGVLPHLHFEIRQMNEGASLRAAANSESKPQDPIPLITKGKYYLEFPANDDKNWSIVP